jgi:hypothetical protein
LPHRDSCTLALDRREATESGINVYASDTREMCET